MNLRHVWEHELSHAAAGAVGLLYLGGRNAYEDARIFLDAKRDGSGECAVCTPGGEDTDLMKQVAALAALGPIARRPDAARLAGESDDVLIEAGLSEADIRLARGWRGSVADRPRLLAAAADLIVRMPTQRLIGILIATPPTGPILLSDLIPRTRARAAIDAIQTRKAAA